jgi:uncharacterized membrane protein YqjE
MRGAGPSGGGRTNGTGTGVVGSIAEFGNDVATLAELQAKLAALDLQECSRRAAAPLAAVAVGLGVMLAALTVALLGVADLLARALGIAEGWTMLMTAAAALLVAGLVLFLSVQGLTRSLEPLRRSREELVRNLSWVRTVLVYSGRSYPRRGE